MQIVLFVFYRYFVTNTKSAFLIFDFVFLVFIPLEAAFAVALGALAVELGGDEYAAEEKMTEKEKEQFNKIIEDLSDKAQKKAEQLGCDLGLDE